MKKKAKEIADGYLNLAKHKLGLTEAKNEEIFNSRRNTCNMCQFKSVMDRCLKCGCPLAAKTRSLTSRCPIGKWDSIK